MMRLSTTLALALLVACGDKEEPTDDTGDTTPPEEVDVDSDGFPADEDCNDEDGSINPDAEEICDGIDNNCNDEIDEGVTTTFYADTDGDGFGDEGVITEACTVPEGYVEDTTDCEDSDAAIYPGADEYCDAADNDCDGEVDEDDAIDAPTWYRDADADGYGDDSDTAIACSAPSGYVDVADDCDDDDDRFHPDAVEDDCTDKNDYNCDGSVGYADEDGDGFAACEECDDTDADINPDAIEVCDGADNDCDTETDEPDAVDAQTWYDDSDADGYGDGSLATVACDQPSGTVLDSTDCDDSDTNQNPGATEYCNSEDDDCDGDIDEDDAADVSDWYYDGDGDGFGDADSSVTTCDQPSDYVSNDTDCDDTDGDVNPGESEVCDEIDNNCDGSIDEDSAIDADTWYADTDEDSYGDPDSSTSACDQPSGYVADSTDCNDANNNINPDAEEVCDAADNNCDGVVDEDEAVDAPTWYADDDSDTYGDASSAVTRCSQPSGYVSDDEDCDDTSAAINPAATEVCDDVDNDCDGDIDDDDPTLDTSTASTWYSDVDGDGYGSSTFTLLRCDQPSNYVSDDTDCDDTDGDVYPGAPDEVYHDGVDQDCDDFDGYTLDDLSTGDLIITELMPNPAAVNDGDGEWFEIHNLSGLDIDVNGLEFADNASSDTVEDTLVIEADGYLVFAVDDDSSVNGGIDADFDWSGPALSNSGDQLSISYGSVIFDEIDYTSDQVDAGVSISLEPDYFAADANDYYPHWCDATSTYGDGDAGTPGSSNDSCGFTTSADDVQTLMDSYCTGCHGGSSPSASLGLEDVWFDTVGVSSGQTSSYNLVESGSSSSSYFYAKIIGDQSALGGYGNDMPPYGSGLSSSEMDLIETWIDEGAPQ